MKTKKFEITYHPPRRQSERQRVVIEGKTKRDIEVAIRTDPQFHKQRISKIALVL